MSSSSTMNVIGGDSPGTGSAFGEGSSPLSKTRTAPIAAGKGEGVQRRVSKRLQRHNLSEHDVFRIASTPNRPADLSPGEERPTRTSLGSPSNHGPRVKRLQLPKPPRQVRTSSSNSVHSYLQPPRLASLETTSDGEDSSRRSSSLPPRVPSNVSQITRPSVHHRGASDPTPIRGSPKNIDNGIKECIQKSVLVENTKGKKAGFIYVVPVLHGDTLVVKVGQTTEPRVENRIKSIKSTCGDTLIFKDRCKDLRDIQVETYHRRIEQLAHAELSNFRYSFDCACNRAHHEYFNVTEEIAHSIVHKWARFCQRSPWDEKGRLKPCWKDRLGRLDCMEAENCHIRRHTHWERFVDVTPLDWAWYEWRQCLWPKLKEYRWQLWCLLLSCHISLSTTSLFSGLQCWITIFAFIWKWMDYTSPTVVEYTTRSFNPQTPGRSMSAQEGGNLPETPRTGDSTLMGDSPGPSFGEDKMENFLPGHWDESGGEEEDGEGNEQAHEDEEDDGAIDLTYLSIIPEPQDIDSSDDGMMRDSGEIAIIVSDVSEGVS